MNFAFNMKKLSKEKVMGFISKERKKGESRQVERRKMMTFQLNLKRKPVFKKLEYGVKFLPKLRRTY